MTRRYATILIVGQLLIDLAFVGYIWVNINWQNRVSSILLDLLRRQGI